MIAVNDVKNIIVSLEDKIHYYDKMYFEQSKTLISDYEYDCLVQQLNDLYSKYPQYKPELSQVDIIGNDLTDGFNKVTHDIPMMSLKKTYSSEDVKKFFSDTEKTIGAVAYVCELKLDGISVDIKYKNGHIDMISTRGNGSIGDDITCNKDLFVNLPANINEDIEVRGEALMTFDDFKSLNNDLKKIKQEPLANPRNATSGALKTLNKDYKHSPQRRITVFFYNICKTTLTTQYEVLRHLQEICMPVCDSFRLCEKHQDVFDYINYWETHKNNLKFPIDGIVIKVNDLQYYDKLGTTNKNPRWAIAYKYKPEATSTKLLSVEYQVGRSGVITPVANFEPITLSGTVVRRATLHNETTMAAMDLRIGDNILVKKSGEIIPYVIGVDINNRNLDAKNIEFIKECPSCNHKLQKINDLSYCLNLNCPARRIELISHFVSKEALNIKSLGPKTIALLVTRDLIKTTTDIFYLNFRDVYRLPGFNTLSTQKLFDECQNAKKTEFYKVLFALGIPHVGSTVARNIVKTFKNIDRIVNASYEELANVPLVGNEVASSVYTYFKDNNNLNIIKQLKNLGFKLD